MKVGDLVRNKLESHKMQVGIVIEIKDDLFFEDVECNIWDYPCFVKVIYPNGMIEFNPTEIYEVISQFDSEA